MRSKTEKRIVHQNEKPQRRNTIAVAAKTNRKRTQHILKNLRVSLSLSLIFRQTCVTFLVPIAAQQTSRAVLALSLYNSNTRSLTFQSPSATTSQLGLFC